MNLTHFKHIPLSKSVNKNRINIVELTYDHIDLFNEIYIFCKKNYLRVYPTPSQAMPNGKYKHKLRWMVVHRNQSHEIVLISEFGCYRFIIQPKKLKGNTIPGRKAVLELYKMFDKHNIDFGKFRCSNGLKIKEEIDSPLIKCPHTIAMGKKFNHVYHLDLNSSYASRIIEAYPELKPAYQELYKNRKENNDKFKHVLTNSIGCFQSMYCPDWDERRKVKPYMFANLAKIAINGTKKLILEMLDKLRNKGMTPLLINTDGIWYISKKGPYHDENEGEELGQWKTDHSDCKFLMTSVGCYQYVENGKCKTVLRGLTSLDQIKERDSWEFGDILKITDTIYYDFDDEKGVVEKYE